MEGNFLAPTNDSYEEEKALMSRIQSDTLRLNQIHIKRIFATGSNSISNQSEDIAVTKLFVKAQDKILGDMLCTMDTCKAQGFVYGLISKEGKVVTGSSETLRSWWQDIVRFHQTGPIAIADYHSTLYAANSSIYKQEVNIREKLLEISDATLGSMISALMPHCDPPQRHHPLGKGIPPCWWPTTNETWWTELGFPSDNGQPPYKKPHDLWKIWKTAVLIAIIKNISPDTDKLHTIVSQYKGLQDKMSAKELQSWSSVLKQVDREYLKENSNAPVSRFNDNASSYLYGNYNPNVDNLNTLLLNNERANNSLNNEGARIAPTNNTAAAQILTQGQNIMNVSLLGHQNAGTDISRMNMNVLQNSRMLPSLRGIQQQQINNGFCNQIQGNTMGNMNGNSNAFHQAGQSNNQQSSPAFQHQQNMNVLQNSRMLPSLQGIQQQQINNGFCNQIQGNTMGNMNGNSNAFHQAGLSNNQVNTYMMQQSSPAFLHQQNMNQSGYHYPEIISNNNMDICTNIYEQSALNNDNMQSADPFPEFDALDGFLGMNNQTIESE